VAVRRSVAERPNVPSALRERHEGYTMRFVCGRRRDEHRARRDAPIHRTSPGARKIHHDLAIVEATSAGSTTSAGTSASATSHPQNSRRCAVEDDARGRIERGIQQYGLVELSPAHTRIQSHAGVARPRLTTPWSTPCPKPRR
jgi:hypothetical protein